MSLKKIPDSLTKSSIPIRGKSPSLPKVAPASAAASASSCLNPEFKRNVVKPIGGDRVSGQGEGSRLQSGRKAPMSGRIGSSSVYALPSMVPVKTQVKKAKNPSLKIPTCVKLDPLPKSAKMVTISQPSLQTSSAAEQIGTGRTRLPPITRNLKKPDQLPKTDQVSSRECPQSVKPSQSAALPVDFGTEESLPLEEPMSPIVSAARNAATAYEKLDCNTLQLNAPDHGSFAKDFIESKYKNAAAEGPTPGPWTETKSTTPRPDLRYPDSLKLVYTRPLWPHQQTLSKRLDKLLGLRNLMLDDSKLSSLRELGSSLPNITTLSIMRCGLTSLDGINGLPSLENLFASDNQIASPSSLAYLTNIRYVDLSGNEINGYDGFQYLSSCSHLRCLKLLDTEIAKRDDFQSCIRKLIPSLRDLHPKISSIHGHNLWSAEEEEEDFGDFRAKNFDLTSATQESKVCTANSVATVSISEEIDQQEVLSKQLDRKIEHELAALSSIFECNDFEARLRNVHRPEKQNFTLRGPSNIIPATIEEMDALLEDMDIKEEAERARRRERDGNGHWSSQSCFESSSYIEELPTDTPELSTPGRSFEEEE